MNTDETDYGNYLLTSYDTFPSGPRIEYGLKPLVKLPYLTDLTLVIITWLSTDLYIGPFGTFDLFSSTTLSTEYEE